MHVKYVYDINIIYVFDTFEYFIYLTLVYVMLKDSKQDNAFLGQG